MLHHWSIGLRVAGHSWMHLGHAWRKHNVWCITRKDKSLSLIWYSLRLGGIWGKRREQRDTRRKGEGRGRGQSVNLCIIRQCSNRERKRGITKMWLSGQNDRRCLVLSYKKDNITLLEACKRCQRGHGQTQSNGSSKTNAMISIPSVTVVSIDAIEISSRFFLRHHSPPAVLCSAFRLHPSKFDWFQSKMTLIFDHLNWPGSP